MSDNYIIEIRPASVGITVQAGVVVRDGRGFRFFAATAAFNSLDGLLFATPKAAEKAARQQVAHRQLSRNGASPLTVRPLNAANRRQLPVS